MRLRILPLLIIVVFISVFIKSSDIVWNLLPVVSEKDFFNTKFSALAEDSNKISNEEGGYMNPVDSGRTPEKVKIDLEEEYFDKNLVESLSLRHKELETREQKISVKESILDAVEQKIDKKMEDLKVLKKEIEEILEEYKEKENTKILRLVKIYENMKSADAARIFNEMEIEILLEVVSVMKEAKVAPILAQMDSLKAKTITVGILKKRRLFVN